MKRLIDIVCSLLGLILLFPLLALVWTAIVLSSGIPGIFRQARVGRRSTTFTLLKFRTMAVNNGSENGSFDAGDVSRVTRIGKLLRASKLDELPQLWNVLAGDMSIVGPRPEVREWVTFYPERWAKVHAVRPGITDPASIEFRNEEAVLAASENPQAYYRDVILPQKLDLYERYVETHTFFGDLKILAKTLAVVIKH